MYITNARFKSTCAETGCKINKGERMLYDKANKTCYAIGSNKAVEFIAKGPQKDNDTDPAAGLIQANEEAFFDNFAQQNNI